MAFALGGVALCLVALVATMPGASAQGTGASGAAQDSPRAGHARATTQRGSHGARDGANARGDAGPTGTAAATEGGTASDAGAAGDAAVALEGGASDAGATASAGGDGGAHGGSSGPQADTVTIDNGTTPTSVTTIHMGIYLLRIHDVDLKAATANVTYYIWTRWRGSEVDGTAYELMNGTVDAREHEYRTEANGEHYAYYRCRGEVTIHVDFRAFPFDEQIITLDFEHSDYGVEAARFEVDEPSMRYLPPPEISGWRVSHPVYTVDEHRYRTNWGMPGASAEEVMVSSRFRAMIRLRHPPVATFAKTFLALFVSVLIALLAFLMHPAELEARVGVGVAGIFGAVTSQAVVSGNLPDIAYLTLADKLHFAGMIAILFALMSSCLVGWFEHHERTELALRIDRWVGALVGVAYTGATIAMLVVR